MNITFRQLQIFSAVAHEGGFTRAAEALHLSQPAVSMQVKQLEEQVGASLYEQVGKRIFLTEAGEEVLRASRAITGQLDDLTAALAHLKGLEKGRLRLSAISTANYFLPKLLGAFVQRHPKVQVSLDVTNRETVLAQLADNDADIGFMGEPPEGADLTAERFMDNPLVIVAPADHPLADAQDIPSSALNDETFLIREPGSGTRAALERFFSQRGLSPSIGLEMSSLEAVKQGVEAGLGIGLLPKDAIGLELKSGVLRILAVEKTPIWRHWYLAHRRGKRLSPVAAAFKDLVLAEAPTLLVRGD